MGAKFLVRVALLLIVAASAFPGIAVAAESVPGDACSPNNISILAGGPETSGKVYLMTCQSGVWVRIMETDTAGKIGIGTPTPQTSLDLSGKTDALLLQTGTTGNRPTGVAGMIRYNSTTPGIEAYYNSAWNSLLSGTATLTNALTLGASATAANPARSGDAGTGLFSATASTVSIATAGVERLRVTATGSVGIGTTSPAYALDIQYPAVPDFSPGLVVSSTAGGGAAIRITQPNTCTYGGLDLYNSNVHWYVGQFGQDCNNDFAIGQNRYSTPAIVVKDTSGKVGIGTTTPAQALEVSGNVNLSAITGGYYIANNKVLFQPASDTTSIAVGNAALASQTATNLNNTAVGIGVLNNNTTGSNNTAVGRYALEYTTTGYDNTANGYSALFSNGSGHGNVANGSGALHANTTGNNNSANGFDALYYATTGANNTANGAFALYANTTGSNNTAIGYNVGSTTLTTGSGNILIGTSNLVDTTASNRSNELNIGNLIYGDTATGVVGIGSATINATLDVNGYAKLKINASAPVTCDATHEGSIAYTGTTTHYLCFCDGTAWEQAHSPATACTW